jgi:hypothetical protein
MKFLVGSLFLAVPAFVGFLLPTPFEDSHARLFDAALSIAVALGVWCGFRLVEPSRYSRRWAIAKVTAVPLVWLLIILGFAVWFHHLEQDRHKMNSVHMVA